MIFSCSVFGLGVSPIEFSLDQSDAANICHVADSPAAAGRRRVRAPRNLTQVLALWSP
jgi:hypothetical protein